MNPPHEDGAVLAPYRGAGWSNTRRLFSRLALPLLILFCLLYGSLFGLFGPFLLGAFPVPLVILALLAIWALPDARTAPVRPLEWLFFAFMLGLILWPNYLALALPGLPWITLTRIIGAPMTVIFLICLSISKPFRERLKDALDGAPIVWRLLAVFAVLQILSVAFSDKIFMSLQKLVNDEINWTTIFFISCFVFMKPGRPSRWAALFCLTMAPICAIAFKEYANSQLPWAEHIPSFLKVQDESVQRILAGAHREGGDYRVQSTFSTPLGLGEYVSLALPFLLHFIAGPYRLVYRLAALVMIPVAIEVVLLSDSRLGLVGCILAPLIYILFWAAFWWRRNRHTVFGPAIVLAYPILLAVTFAATLLIGRIRERIYGSGQYADSNHGRTEMYQQGIPMVLHHPWGFGIGRGAETLNYTNAAGILTIDTYYLLIALEYGIVGFILYYATIASAVYYSATRALRIPGRRSEYMLLIPLGAALVNFFIIKSVFSNDDNHPLVYMMMGMVVALCARLAEEQKPANDVITPAATSARRAR